jgi:ABC-type nitrate/sulfonate/bicarbonate transport system substrate-binding protein
MNAQSKLLVGSTCLMLYFTPSNSFAEESKELAPVVFQADWFPNAQFAGFFWAQTGGLYAAHGLEVSFPPFDFGVDFLAKVSSGEAAFGTAEAYILMDAVARGEELVALGAVLGESPAGYIFLKESGIQTAADLKGKRVGVHNYAEALLPFFVAEAGLPADSVEAVEVQHKIEKLLDGSVDLHQGYAIDEMIRLQSMTDKPVDILLFEQLGMPMYSMVIYSSRKFVEENPEIVRAFMAASGEGWEAAMKSPEIAALVVNGPYGDPYIDDAIVGQQARTLKPFVLKDGRATLSMTREKWEAMQAAYLESGMIDKPVDLDAFLMWMTLGAI